ncbi:Hsp20/alpha crystallin family protein [Lentisphaerota bacterium WC36G]|nr:Hsp20/alpha crystallin family protein [Lentisphaerae bacterium WC36]
MTKEIEKKLEYVTFTPPVDIVEKSDGLDIFLDVPGACQECLDVNIEDNVLSIKAETNTKYNDKFIKYERAFSLSDDLAADKTSAKVEDGQLKMHIPKNEEAKIKRITVT